MGQATESELTEGGISREMKMSRILITSGPTRQYVDAVRYLTNASSGRMGRALAEAMIELGHEVVVVTGPVEVDYPTAAEVVHVTSTEEMLEACQRLFPRCQGVIGVAAPCDYRPVHVAQGKIQKTGQPLELHLIETPDIIATLGLQKQNQWLVGFALEVDDQRLRALAKLEKKHCDLMVLNGPQAMHAAETRVEVIDARGEVIATLSGAKESVAQGIAAAIQSRLINTR
jgi:phosphopantothenoylcysteine decarboxylase/phosphopantothenate--cysteine ligase